jgi:hypothetical protein
MTAEGARHTRDVETSLPMISIIVNNSNYAKFLPQCIESALARDLGGGLRPQMLTWKYAPVQAVFGWAAACRTRAKLAHWKSRAHLTVERRGLRG